MTPIRPLGAPARAVALVLVWSAGFIGAELGARAAPPSTVLAWRFLVTAVVLLPWLLRASGRLDRREWMRQAVLALLCQCLYLAGVFWAAAAGVPAGTSALIASLQPALVVTGAVLMGGGRLRVGHVTGLVLGSTGVALAAAGDLGAGVGITALALPLSAMLSLTVGTLLQQRWSAPSCGATPLLQTLAVQAVFGAGFFTAYTAAAGELAPPPTAEFWTAIAWAALAGIGSYGLYYLVTTRDGAARASTLLYVTPAATALWAMVMFGQPLRPAAVIGLLVSAAAVGVLGAAGTPKAPPPSGDPRRPERAPVPYGRTHGGGRRAGPTRVPGFPAVGQPPSRDRDGPQPGSAHADRDRAGHRALGRHGVEPVP